jgi:lipopolysaccharide export system permease protein
LSTRDLLISLAKIGLVFSAITLLVGEFVAPPAERAAQQLRLKAMGSLVAQEFRSGLWVRDEKSFVNVREVLPDTSLRNVRVFEFDERFQLISISEAERGRYIKDGAWMLDRGGAYVCSSETRRRWNDLIRDDLEIRPQS